MPFTKTGSFGWAGGGKAGALVDLWAAYRFSGVPALNDPPPDGNPPDYGPVTTGPDFGNPGAYFIDGITDAIDFWVRIQYAGNQYWGFCPLNSLGGESPDGGGGITPPAGDIGGTTSDPLVIGIQGFAVDPSMPSDGEVLTWDEGSSQYSPAAGSGGVQVGGDLGGTDESPVVTGIQTIPMLGTTPTTGEIIGFDGTHWGPTTPAASGGGTISLVTTSTPGTVTLTNASGPTLNIDVSGGAGAAGELISTAFLVTPSSGLASGALLGFTPNIADGYYNITMVPITAWSGGIAPAYFDIGTLTSGNNGILAEVSSFPTPVQPGQIIGSWPLQTAAVALPGNAGILFGCFDLQTTLASLGFTTGPPVGSAFGYVSAANPLFIIISQDGSNLSPLAASVTAGAAPTGGYPFVISSPNNLFSYLDTSPTLGGGGLLRGDFTVPPASCANIGAVATQFNLAVNGATPITTYGTFSASGSVLKFTAVHAGAGGNGNKIDVPSNPLHDISQRAGFTLPSILSGGQGGDPGASSGQIAVILTTATPA